MKEFIEKLKKRSENQKINAELKSYPCSDYLHNALRFISNGQPEVAYDEICCAIIRSGGSLTESEEKNRKDLKGTE